MSDALAGTDYISRLESRIETMTGKSAIALNSADAAIHTALYLCGASRGDYVFVPTYTFYPNIATVTNLGCQPVFLDCDPMSRCVSPSALEAALFWAELQNKPPKAVIVDDAFGAVADYDVLMPLCKAYCVPVIELASDAFGGEYRGRACGACADYGIIGLTKRVGGGGCALITSREEREAALRFIRGKYTQGENHDYKMHNVIAALDCAMIEPAKKVTSRAKANLAALCAASEAVVHPTDGDAATYALCKPGAKANVLRDAGFTVKTPPPVHTLPQYNSRPFFEHEQGFCVSKTLAEHCLIDMDISAAKRRKLVRLLKAVRL